MKKLPDETTVTALLDMWKGDEPGHREAVLNLLYRLPPHIATLFIVIGLQDKRIVPSKGEHNIIVNGLMDRFEADRDASDAGE